MKALICKSLLGAIGLAGIMLFCTVEASAAGLTLSPRGVRPLGRAGAFIAGAQGIDAMSYNPAGLVEGPSQILLDFGIPVHFTQYTRRVFPDSSPEPTVEGRSFGMPSPTVGISHDLTLPNFRIGLALMGDYPLLQHWPDELDDGSPAPQRYAIIDYRGTAMSKVGLAAAYRFGNFLTIGAGLNVLWGTFASTSTASACDGTICTQPENPDYDTTIQMIARNVAALAPHVGIIVTPIERLRLGVAWEGGYRVNKEAELHIRMPSAGIYRGATIDPEEPTATLSMRLPMALRAGLEVSLDALGRIEGAFVWEPWSVHDNIRLDAGNVRMRNVLALDDYALGQTVVDRSFRNTYSVRLGSEWYMFSPVTFRAGILYEPSAIPDETLTPMAVDLDKIIPTIGLDYSFGMVVVSFMYAYVFMFDRDVNNSRVLQTNPTRPGWEGRTPVGNGSYSAFAHIFGLGFTINFGDERWQYRSPSEQENAAHVRDTRAAAWQGVAPGHQ